MKKKYIAIIAIALIGGGYYWYSKTNSTKQSTQYKTEITEKGNLVVSVSASGQAEAVSQVEIKPVVAGDAIEVMGVYVKNDQVVKKGDLIALLDSSDAQKTVRNAQLNLDSTKVKYVQAKRDFDKNKINKLSLESQEVSLQQSKNSLADAKEELDDYFIRAPFDGIITGLSVGAGDSVSRSDILASVITKDVHAVVAINEIDASQVKVNNKVTIKIGALNDAMIMGKVTKIDTIGQTTQNVVSYNAEISFDEQNELLKPGMSVTATIITNVKQDVIIVSSGAIKSQNGNSYVEILNDGATNPRQVSVELGLANDTKTEIISGLKEGDKVITQTIDSTATTKSTSSSSNSSGFKLPGMGSGGLR